MGEWKEYKLGEVAEVIDSLHRTPTYSKKGYPMVRVTDINRGYLNLENTLKVDESTFNDFSQKRLPRRGDIVFSRVGSYGVSSLVNSDEPFCLGQNTTLIVAKENPCFLYYFLNTPNAKSQIDGLVAGSTQPTISLQSIKEILVPYPLCAEQKSIASVLSSLDDKIDLLHRQNKTLEALAETLFRQWFVEEAEEGWKTGKLGDVIELVYGKGLKDEIRSGSGFPVVGSSGIVGYHSEFLVEGPGIVIGRKGTLGKVIYLFENFFPIDTTYFVKSKVNSEGLFYEYFLLKTLNFEDMNSDSAVPGLNRELALSTEIKIAPFDKLKQYNNYCATLFEKLKQNNSQIRTLTRLRDTLLPKLMSGEVRVKEN